MATISRGPQFWKQEGNDHVKHGRYLKAIECYDNALFLTKLPSEACILLLNRSHARLQIRAFDGAVADADAALNLPPANTPPNLESEKGRFRSAKALYGLRNFEGSHAFLKFLNDSSSRNLAEGIEMKKCEMRMKEEKGDIDFGSMLEEATKKYPSPDMDRADYVGPIEVRPCANPEHGRGLFTTKDVKAGDLLLLEKAFAAVFPTPTAKGHETTKNDANEDNDSVKADEKATVSAGERAENSEVGVCGKRPDLDYPKDEEVFRLRAELSTKIFVKLHRNPSLQKEFMELYPGPDADEEIDEETGKVEVDDAAVPFRIKYNAFGFPILSHTYHYANAHDPYAPSTSIFTAAGSRGVWLKASYINHSCYPLVRRSFIGDMMIFRAQADIPANTELKFGYISAMETLKERKAMLKNYGFECACSICVAEGSTPHKRMKKRDNIAKEIIALFEKGEEMGLHIYMEKLEAMDKTYIHPPSVEPRKMVITPIINILPELLRCHLYIQAIELILRLLGWLGFEVAVTNSSFKVTKWGFLVDEIPMVLADLCDAFRIVRPMLFADGNAVAKKAYLIMCGEDESWEMEYGRDGRHALEGGKGKVEDLVDGVGGMKFAKDG